MKLKELINVDAWWKAVLYSGLALIAVSLPFSGNKIVKHLIGVGLGMLIVGISYFAANKHVSSPAYGGVLSTQKIMHTRYTRLSSLIGMLIVALFLVLLIVDLI
jgi:hypothetical protein